MVRIYGIKNCDTMKKARAWLEERGVGYEFHDYKACGIERAQLERWAGSVGWTALINRAGTTFRRLSEAQKSTLDERSALALMQEQPTLIRRPVLELGEQIMVGFRPALYEQAFRAGGAGARPAP